MPNIKTRKAIQEESPESRAASQVGNSAKQVKRAVKTAKRTVQVSKTIVIGTKTIVKATAAAAKSLVAAIASGGWIAAAVIFVVCLVVFFGGFFLSPEGVSLQAVALSQVGNVGGEPYWSWYGYPSRVEWCACFVSWCGEQCGYLETEIIPKYDSCTQGVLWFKDREQWLDGSDIPVSGMIIFFDWDFDDMADHTGIVTEIKNELVVTVEGNYDDSVAINQYVVGDNRILGYGMPLLISKKDASP